MRASTARSRSSSSRAASPCANGAGLNSTRAGPRQSASASRSEAEASSTLPSASAPWPAARSRSKRWRSSCSAQLENIPRRPSSKNPRRQALAKPRDVGLNRLRGTLRPSLTPKIVDQPVTCDRLVRVQNQDRKERPLLPEPSGNEVSSLPSSRGPRTRNSTLSPSSVSPTYHSERGNRSAPDSRKSPSTQPSVHQPSTRCATRASTALVFPRDAIPLMTKRGGRS